VGGLLRSFVVVLVVVVVAGIGSSCQTRSGESDGILSEEILSEEIEDVSEEIEDVSEELNDIEVDESSENVVESGDSLVEIDPKRGWEIDEFVRFTKDGQDLVGVEDRYLGDLQEAERAVFEEVKPPFIEETVFDESIVIDDSHTLPSLALPIAYWVSYPVDDVPDSLIRGYFVGETMEDLIASKKSGSVDSTPVVVKKIFVSFRVFPDEESGNNVYFVRVDLESGESKDFFVERVPGGQLKVLPESETGRFDLRDEDRFGFGEEQ
jgi:hypothetical protein